MPVCRYQLFPLLEEGFIAQDYRRLERRWIVVSVALVALSALAAGKSLYRRKHWKWAIVSLGIVPFSMASGLRARHYRDLRSAVELVEVLNGAEVPQFLPEPRCSVPSLVERAIEEVVGQGEFACIPKELHDDVVAAAIRHSPQAYRKAIAVLTVTRLDLAPLAGHINEADIDWLATRQGELTQLTLVEYEVTEAALQRLAASCPLTHLCVRNCPRAGAGFLETLARERGDELLALEWDAPVDLAALRQFSVLRELRVPLARVEGDVRVAWEESLRTLCTDSLLPDLFLRRLVNLEVAQLPIGQPYPLDQWQLRVLKLAHQSGMPLANRFLWTDGIPSLEELDSPLALFGGGLNERLPALFQRNPNLRRLCLDGRLFQQHCRLMGEHGGGLHELSIGVRIALAGEDPQYWGSVTHQDLQEMFAGLHELRRLRIRMCGSEPMHRSIWDGLQEAMPPHLEEVTFGGEPWRLSDDDVAQLEAAPVRVRFEQVYCGSMLSTIQGFPAAEGYIVLSASRYRELALRTFSPINPATSWSTMTYHLGHTVDLARYDLFAGGPLALPRGGVLQAGDQLKSRKITLGLRGQLEEENVQVVLQHTPALSHLTLKFEGERCHQVDCQRIAACASAVPRLTLQGCTGEQLRPFLLFGKGRQLLSLRGVQISTEELIALLREHSRPRRLEVVECPSIDLESIRLDRGEFLGREDG